MVDFDLHWRDKVNCNKVLLRTKMKSEGGGGDHKNLGFIGWIPFLFTGAGERRVSARKTCWSTPPSCRQQLRYAGDILHPTLALEAYWPMWNRANFTNDFCLPTEIFNNHDCFWNFCQYYKVPPKWITYCVLMINGYWNVFPTYSFTSCYEPVWLYEDAL